MYHIAVSWDVQPERVPEFIAAALKDGREAGAAEEGTLRFELIADTENPTRFYLNEAYADETAFNTHAEGQYFKEFFAEVSPYAEISWLYKGTTVTE